MSMPIPFPTPGPASTDSVPVLDAMAVTVLVEVAKELDFEGLPKLADRVRKVVGMLAVSAQEVSR
ncbi:hypothetical protein [Nocardia sp. NPDC046763]|uniref:hypothetical protein n=1 Tax=Nocardia sp. NPDC046763 TaxID=3155256 RepID=UPI0033EF6DE2